MTGPDHDDALGDGYPVQRVTSAHDAPPVHVGAASSVFNWRGNTAAADDQVHTPVDEAAGSASTEVPPQEPQPQKEETMPKKRGARVRASNAGGPQMQVCSALMAHGDPSREQLAEALPDLSAARISSALHTAKANKRVAWIAKDSVYRLTAAGQAWVNDAGAAALAADGPTEQQSERATRKTAHRRGRRARKAAAAVDTSPSQQQQQEEPTFRCAVMSDGCFFITKDGTTIELEPEEHAQMLHYLERMAEAA